jgi:dipeptidyl-peptidase-4
VSPWITRLVLYLAVPAVLLVLQFPLDAQDRLKSMPGFAQHEKMAPLIASAIQPGTLAATWSADGRSFEYAWNGRQYRYDIEAGKAEAIGAAPPAQPGRGGRGRAPGAPERGRQYTTAESPDKQLRAVYKEDRNLYLVDVASGAETAITTDGSPERRIKYGSASWVYGEELDQNTAMWWSPDGRKLAFYRFDESPVRDYYLQLAQTRIQSEMDVEAYPKAGTANPIVDLLIYDVDTKKTITLDVRSGRPFDNKAVGHYVYRILWSPDGRELLFTRTNRRQNVLELVAADRDSGALRVILREEWPTGWVENNPLLVFLDDGRRFIWESERNGWNNLYLYDLAGRLLTPLTTHTTFEAVNLIKVDEAAGLVFYTARDGDNHLKLQLHRVGLDGRGDVRLTDPAFHHTIGSCRRAAPPAAATGTPCAISPDNRYFIDIYQAHDTPPATRLVNAEGKVVAELASTDLTKFNESSLRKVEMFTFTAADARTTLHGLIHFPSNFDPRQKYPVLVPVYGGPGSASNTARETFVMPHALTEYGFIVVNVDSRAAPGRGKRTLDHIYLKLGQVEIDDMAAGVRALWDRPYIDRGRIGIYGTSYGGYASLMSLLRHPDVYAAASASSPVTAWYHYDTIYTERYMWIPQENKEGYEAGSAMTYVKNLQGRLMLYYGTADNNVHPSNMMQLIAALQAEGKSFDVQVGPDRGHSGINQARMMEFFIEHLVLKAPVAATY